MQTTVDPNGAGNRWASKHVYTMASICLVLGLSVGYLFRGSQLPKVQPAPVPTAPASEAKPHSMPTMDQMKHMAAKTAEPLLEQLKAQPNDPALLSKIAKTYFSANQVPEAISYAQRAVQADPKQVGNRADLASYLYYSGDTERAIAALQDALNVEPNNAQVLFNLGLITLKGKNDAPGAVAFWKRLLKSNPNLPDPQKKMVNQAIAGASRKPKQAAN